jgi:transcriptional regulator with XRE-family HTH domain
MKKEKYKIMEQFAKRLAKLRNILNLSRPEMAAHLGITSNALGKNERGEHFLDIPALNRLSTDFNVSMDWLIFGKGPIIINHQKINQSSQQEFSQPKKEELSLWLNNEPDALEILTRMKQDMSFRYEIFAYNKLSK